MKRPWNGNEYEMKPRQIYQILMIWDHMLPLKTCSCSNCKTNRGGFADPSTLDAQRARVIAQLSIAA